MRSEAATPKEYLDGLPPERRAVVAAVRKRVRASMPKGFKESMNWGMIAWEVPLKRYPQTYNGQPLMYVALAAQKNHYALYLTGIYSSEARRKAFEEAWAATGKKLDMGKSCLRFKRLDDLDLDLVAEAIAGVDVDDFIESYESAKGRR